MNTQTPNCLKVSDLMTQYPTCIHPDTTLTEAIKLLHEKNIRHLPVTSKDGRLRGLVTNRDMLAIRQINPNAFSTNRVVAQMMSTDIDTVSPSDCAFAAARHMFAYKRGCLVAIINKIVVGILTESDFVRYFSKMSNCNCSISKDSS